MQFFADNSVGESLSQSTNAIKQISDTLFSSNSLFVLILSLIAASILSKILSVVLRKLSRVVGRTADASTNLETVNRLRRTETWIILSIAVVRLLCFVFALYFWWVVTHPDGGKPTALIGASAIIIVIIGGVFSPLLRDLAFGSGMMAEHWYGVGDLIKVEPFMDMQGVVERITLRSTRIRGLNGEVIWVTNQNIAAVHIAQKGVLTVAIEIFVTDPKKADVLIEKTNALLPTGPSLVASRLDIISSDEHDDSIWHVTAVAETAPGRQWLIEKTAIDLMKEIDEKSSKPILITSPFARYADNDTERQFARAVKNAKKTKRTPRRLKSDK